MKYVKIIDVFEGETLLKKDSIERLVKGYYTGKKGIVYYNCYTMSSGRDVFERFDNYEDRDAVFDSMQRELEDE